MTGVQTCALPILIRYYLKTAPVGAENANTAPQGGRGGGGRGGFGGAQCVADAGDGTRPSLTIADAGGKAVCILMPPARAGMNEVVWPLNGPGGPAEPGEYTFTLKVGGQNYMQKERLVSRATVDPSRAGRGGGQ